MSVIMKAFPLKRERLAGEFGEGLGEAVTEIHPCRAAALAEVVEGLSRDMRPLDSHGFDHNANAAKQCVALLGDLHDRANETSAGEVAVGGMPGSPRPGRLSRETLCFCETKPTSR